MRTTEYNSNNCLTPEFRWTSFEKRNNLDELINIPTEAEERYITQNYFVYGPRSEHQDRHNPEFASKITADPRSTVFSNSANPLDFRTNSQSVRFLRPNPSIRKPFTPPLVWRLWNNAFCSVLKGRWDFQFCGSGQFLVRFFDSHFKTTVFQFWCLARLASFLQFRLWFSVLSIMMAVFRIFFLSRTFYGFSGFAKKVTPCSHAKIVIQETTYIAFHPFLWRDRWQAWSV